MDRRLCASVTPSAVQPGNMVQAGNVLAEPQAPPPNYGAVAAPIGYPAVNMVQGSVPSSRAAWPVAAIADRRHPGFMTPQQSPLGNGFVAPLGQPQSWERSKPVPQSVGQMSVPPTAPMMAGQPPLTTASGWATVSYPPAGGTGGRRCRRLSGNRHLVIHRHHPRLHRHQLFDNQPLALARRDAAQDDGVADDFDFRRGDVAAREQLRQSTADCGGDHRRLRPAG